MPANMLGQTETKCQQLRRALHHQRAGLDLPDGAQLEQERHVETAELDPLSNSQVMVMVYATAVQLQRFTDSCHHPLSLSSGSLHFVLSLRSLTLLLWGSMRHLHLANNTLQLAF